MANCAAVYDWQSQNSRVAAANTLLDRAYGKAPTFSTTDPGTFKRAIDMTDDELAGTVAARQRRWRQFASVHLNAGLWCLSRRRDRLAELTGL
jgi:hypothetical protein